MLPHEKEHQFVLADAEFAAHTGEIIVAVVGNEVATVVDDLNVAFVAILVDDVFDRSLGHPHLVGLLVESDDVLDYFVNHDIAFEDTDEVVTVFGVEGCHHRDILHLGYLESRLARAERTVGMDELKLPLEQLAEVDRIHFGHSGHVRVTEGHGH